MASTEWKWFIVQVSGPGSAGEIRGFVEEGENQAAFSSAAQLIEILSSRSRSGPGDGGAAANGALEIACACCPEQRSSSSARHDHS